MTVDPVDFISKEHRRIVSITSRTVFMTYVKHLIESRVECIRFKYLHDLIHQVKNHFVDLWMQGAIAFTIQSVVVGPFIFFGEYYAGRFIKLGIDFQQSAQVGMPGLVAEQIDLRDQADAIRSEEHTSELQSRENLVCRLLLEKKKEKKRRRCL